MKNNPTEILKKEHDKIELADYAINRMNGLWERDEATYIKLVQQLLLFFKEYSDIYHHHKEEEILFPMMRDNPDFVLHDIIMELEEHHDMFRSYAADIKEALEEKKYDLVQSTLGKYINQLLDHIAVENDELFIMAENLFDERDLETMYFRFLDIDRELTESRKAELENIPVAIIKELEADEQKVQ